MTDSDAGSAERSSISQNLLNSTANIWKSRIYKTLTLKDLSFDTYRVFLFLALIINLVFLLLQVIRFAVIIIDDNGTGNDLSLVIIAFTLTTINCGYLIKLMYAPTPSFAVTCMGIIIVQEILFIAQTIIYYKYFVRYDAVIALSVVFLFLQLGTIIPVYRYWELVLFNYDDSGWSGSPSAGGPSDVGLDNVGGNRKSTGHLHPSKVKNQMHIENDNAV